MNCKLLQRYAPRWKAIRKLDVSFVEMMTKTRRKEHDVLSHWMECIKKKKRGEGQAVVCIEEAGGRAPNQVEKVS